jgi:hypothetical protein
MSLSVEIAVKIPGTLFFSDMRRANGRPQPSLCFRLLAVLSKDGEKTEQSHRTEFHRDQTLSEPLPASGNLMRNSS